MKTVGYRRVSTARAVGYIRVSTDDQKLSPEAQREAINRWSMVNKINVVGIYEDLGVSGSTPLEERPGMTKTLNHLDNERCDFVVVATHDRVSRDMLQALLLEQILRRKKAQLVTVLEDPDAELTPETTLNKRVIQAFAEYERAQIRRRTKNALAQLKLTGKKLGPPSFERTKAGREVARMVCDLHDSGMGYRKIVDTLRARNVKPLRGKLWHVSAVRAILSRGRERFQERTPQ